MMDAPQFLMYADLDAKALESWVSIGWLTPCLDDAGWRFSETQLARARLLRDLMQDKLVDEDGVNAVLDLLDQIRSLRRMLCAMLVVARALPEPLSHRIAVELLDRDVEHSLPSDESSVGIASGEPLGSGLN
jgi:chaperone modulatory protein CbpM